VRVDIGRLVKVEAEKQLEIVPRVSIIEELIYCAD
jgi:hypothetical protein